ncbi:DUF169 domain-containing protein [Dysgonomonas macrotermitis]|uniref:Uncharacterized ArCR, COG2043 n=1 Tax=Dysgonomonas macrotermitis TaxID=1346286 RepID=A0A1M4SJ21_9BACT|nr:DUF169 domain-containing protein [Dysgonomonas macrotermitis]SHE32205.1 Uncharacterised ArCR, COG2043 [Dysgonomonas macrotermitis]
MKVNHFVNKYKEAFGDAVELPIVFWYSDRVEGLTEKINGCFFKGMKEVRSGNTISLNAENISCGGGKFYTGFTPMPEHVPNFVSLKEKYKETPQMVLDFIDELQVPLAASTWLHFARIDKVEDFERLEGIIFFATPDILSGLLTWTWFDTNEKDAVTTEFGSGCSAIVTQATLENRKGGKRTFLGLFDPSVRPWFEPDLLSFVIPLSRFREMYSTMEQCCLFDTHAWRKIRERINLEM